MADAGDNETHPSLGEGDVTRLLRDVERGDGTAVSQLLPLVYDELHAIAAKAFRERRNEHSLQPTAIVHDAYLKLVGHAGSLNDRSHFYVVAAKAMRQMLTDHARRRAADKHGGAWQRVSLAGVDPGEHGDELDLVALDEAMTKLADVSARQAKIVELRFLAGLEVAEVAEILDVSTRTVVAEWRTARAFLRARIEEEKA